jgi:uncharacterized protein (TIGR03435 family)
MDANLPAMKPEDKNRRVRSGGPPPTHRPPDTRAIQILLATAASIAFAAPVVVTSLTPVVRQSSIATTQASRPIEFEAASVKVLPEDPEGTRPLTCRGVDGVANIVGFRSTAPVGSNLPLGRCIGSEQLKVIISVAYDVPVERISGEPSWKERFEITAAAPDTTQASAQQLREMLQGLLADRFRLRVHRQSRDVRGYALTVAKGGVKFKRATGGEDIAGGRTASPGSAPGTLWIKGNFRLDRLAEFFWRSPVFGQPVTDRTMLDGLYDIDLTLHRTDTAPAVGGPRSGGGVLEFDPPFLRALEEQLGLRLEPATVPIEFLVIDRVERPTPN